jgi:hypothetical protein
MYIFVLLLRLGNLKREHPIRIIVVVVVVTIDVHSLDFVFRSPDNTASVVGIDKGHSLVTDLGQVSLCERVSVPLIYTE